MCSWTPNLHFHQNLNFYLFFWFCDYNTFSPLCVTVSSRVLLIITSEGTWHEISTIRQCLSTTTRTSTRNGSGQLNVAVDIAIRPDSRYPLYRRLCGSQNCYRRFGPPRNKFNYHFNIETCLSRFTDMRVIPSIDSGPKRYFHRKRTYRFSTKK
jgi:hypothetical protein